MFVCFSLDLLPCADLLVKVAWLTERKVHVCWTFCFTEKLPQLMELFHSLDIWHKAKKLNKCLHQVSLCHDFYFHDICHIKK